MAHNCADAAVSGHLSCRGIGNGNRSVVIASKTGHGGHQVGIFSFQADHRIGRPVQRQGLPHRVLSGEKVFRDILIDHAHVSLILHVRPVDGPSHRDQVIVLVVNLALSLDGHGIQQVLVPGRHPRGADGGG